MTSSEDVDGDHDDDDDKDTNGHTDDSIGVGKQQLSKQEAGTC